MFLGPGVGQADIQGLQERDDLQGRGVVVDLLQQADDDLRGLAGGRAFVQESGAEGEKVRMFVQGVLGEVRNDLGEDIENDVVQGVDGEVLDEGFELLGGFPGEKRGDLGRGVGHLGFLDLQIGDVSFVIRRKSVFRVR